MGAGRCAAGLPFLDFAGEYEFVALRHPDEYPMNEGRLVSSRGLDDDASPPPGRGPPAGGALGLLPPRVVIWAVAGASFARQPGLTPAVAAAVPELVRRTVAESDGDFVK